MSYDAPAGSSKDLMRPPRSTQREIEALLREVDSLRGEVGAWRRCYEAALRLLPEPDRALLDEQNKAPQSAEDWAKRFETLAAEFRALPPNWDSYDGVPISEEAIRAARRFLLVVPTSWDLVPLGDGGVQLEWYVSGVEFVVAFDPKGRALQT